MDPHVKNQLLFMSGKEALEWQGSYAEMWVAKGDFPGKYAPNSACCNAEKRDEIMTALTKSVSVGLTTPALWPLRALRRELSRLRDGLARRDAYRRAYCALQSSSDEELATSGLTRRQVRAAAHDRAMGLTLGQAAIH